MPPPPNIKLTAEDITLFTHLYQLRIATITHLVALTGRSHKALYRRLAKLTAHQLLYRRRNYVAEKYVYTLGAGAVPLLVEHGVAPAETIALHMRRLRELTPLFINHALMLADIHTCLRLASRTSPATLTAWREGHDLYDSVTTRTGLHEQTLPIRPDAFITLEDSRRLPGKNHSHYLIEADRSTTTHERFIKKIKAYCAFYEQRQHTKKYGIDAFRVLTLTLTQQRADNLREAARSVFTKKSGLMRFYYFAPVSHFTFDNPNIFSEEIFLTPRDDRRYSLTPKLTGDSSTA